MVNFHIGECNCCSKPCTYHTQAFLHNCIVTLHKQPVHIEVQRLPQKSVLRHVFMQNSYIYRLVSDAQTHIGWGDNLQVQSASLLCMLRVYVHFFKKENHQNTVLIVSEQKGRSVHVTGNEASTIPPSTVWKNPHLSSTYS